MRGYIKTAILGMLSLSFLLFFSNLDAAPENGGLATGPFQWHGSVELGYRLTDIEGRDRYKEVVNLMEGLRLFNLSLQGKNQEKKGLVDSLSFNLNGIGDPFPYGRLQIKKAKTYDLVVTYRESRYFFNREDFFTPSLGEPFTDNHDFHQRRRQGAVTLTIFPQDDFRLNFGYSHAQRAGDMRTPRAFIYLLDIPNLEQDLKERLNEFFVSADFSIGTWNFHVKQSRWNFKNENEIEEPGFLVEKRKEDMNTYVSTAKGHTRVGERLDLDLGFTYAHSNGRAHFTNPFSTTEGKTDFNTQIAELGLSYLLMKKAVLHFDYQFHRLSQDGRAETFKPTYELHAHTGTFQIEVLPIEKLTLRGGYRFQYRDIDAENLMNVEGNLAIGGKDSQDTIIRTHGWIGSLDWKPYKSFSIYGEYQGADFDNPYTRISPEHENIAKLRVKYNTPLNGLNLKGSVLWKRKTNPDQRYRIDVQDYVFAAGYQPSFLPRLSLDASFTYEKIRDKKNITNNLFAFPVPPPFTRFVFDSDALIYSGGMSYEGIFKGLGARFNGSYARTRDENSQKYADGLISIWYKNKWVTPILTLERTYLIDRERRNDGFDANLLTFSLNKEF
ncbi:MAG: hypothetical protein A2V86_00170 [Deltaproteobacteria bacterium RBG_16_49_23]|nr:MAG: hypothetical protein A2V86_00170 [Deltaproteobacteria bacterium RBG_16_49_23]